MQQEPNDESHGLRAGITGLTAALALHLIERASLSHLGLVTGGIKGLLLLFLFPAVLGLLLELQIRRAPQAANDLYPGARRVLIGLFLLLPFLEWIGRIIEPSQGVDPATFHLLLQPSGAPNRGTMAIYLGLLALTFWAEEPHKRPPAPWRALPWPPSWKRRALAPFLKAFRPYFHFGSGGHGWVGGVLLLTLLVVLSAPVPTSPIMPGLPTEVAIREDLNDSKTLNTLLDKLEQEADEVEEEPPSEELSEEPLDELSDELPVDEPTDDTATQDIPPTLPNVLPLTAGLDDYLKWPKLMVTPITKPSSAVASSPFKQDTPLEPPLLLAPRETIHNLPPRPQAFVGRAKILKKLAGHLDVSSNAPIQVLAGRDGLGKRRIALEYAYRHQDNFHLIHWINSDNPASLTHGIETLADRLQIPKGRRDFRRRALLKALAKRDDWLLIFHNVAQAPQALQGLIPNTNNGGRVLITSHLMAWHRLHLKKKLGMQVIGPPKPAEAVRLMNQRIEPGDMEQVAALAKELGHLPLALLQAAAYLEQNRTSKQDASPKKHSAIKQYRKQIRDARLALITENDNPDTAAPTHVDATVRLAMRQIGKSRPEAIQWLKLMAFLGSEQIPLSLFIKQAAKLPEPLASVAEKRDQLLESLQLLSGYGLILRSGEHIALHPMTQKAVRRAMSNQEQRWLLHATRLIQAAFPYDPDNPATWPSSQTMAPHALSLFQHLNRLQPPLGEASFLLERLGGLMERMGRPAKAIEVMQSLLAMQEAAYGPDHPWLARTLTRLARLYTRRGETDRAIERYRRAMKVVAKADSPDHPRWEALLSELRDSLEDQEGYPEIKALYSRALGDKKNPQASTTPDQLPGSAKAASALPPHLTPADQLGGLLKTLESQGDTKKRLQRALEIAEQTYGPDHPKTAVALNNLGRIRADAERFLEASELHARALTILESTLGMEHDSVSGTLTLLAKTLHELGKYEQAKVHLERAHVILTKQLDPDHPKIAALLNQMGLLLIDLEQHNAARRQFNRALTILQKRYGSQHLKVAETLIYLGEALHDLRENETARDRLEQALKILERVHGPDHAELGDPLNTLGQVLHELGEIKLARETLERELTINEKAYGPDSPQVAMTLGHISVLHLNRNLPKLAKPVMERVVQIYRKTLPKGHPHIQAAEQNLAIIEQIIEGMKREKQ
ncbi:MAG: tetratricopeptide repeat protein [Magnetococcales bacterium]|nr:tetratricopeptide repeat protein [Magnetococcales bacterium]